MFTQFGAGGIKCVLCECTGTGLLEACAPFPVDCALAFPFADLALYSFTVINHSCVPSPVNFLIKSLTGK